jgi:transcriptional regulator of acetoin/glycerol metabolism
MRNYKSASFLSSAITRSLVGAYGASIMMNEREKFEKAIIKAHGDRSAAAKILGISRSTFFRRAKDLGLVRERNGHNGNAEQRT